MRSIQSNFFSMFVYGFSTVNRSNLDSHLLTEPDFSKTIPKSYNQIVFSKAYTT